MQPNPAMPVKTEAAPATKAPITGKPHSSMKAKAKPEGAEQPKASDAWRGFNPGLWQRDINVRWFIQQNYTPYDGDGTLLAPATACTKHIWKKLEDLFVEERKKS